MNLIDYLPAVPDFPKPGIIFRDISPLVADPNAFKSAIEQMATLSRDFQFTHIFGIESRGFIFASALAFATGRPLILIRKLNKLPLAVHRESYGLEYGADVLEMQQSTLTGDSKALLIDDVLATGGTMVAAAKLAAKAGAQIAGAITLLEIKFLQGAATLSQHGIRSQSILQS